MSAAGLLAALAVLLGFAAARELLAGRRGGERPLPFGLRGRSAGAALRLGLPERLRRSGLEARLPLPAVLARKLAGGGLRRLAALAAAPGGAGADSPAGRDRDAGRRLRRPRRAAGARGAPATAAAWSRPCPTPSTCSRSAPAPAAAPPPGLEQLARAGEGPLAEELRVTVAELSCGTPLGAALRSLRARVPGSELATLVASIERSRRFGSPLADQLRRQSSALRRDSRRAVEERAARAAPKIQLVVALVLVPSVLLMIAAGP